MVLQPTEFGVKRYRQICQRNFIILDILSSRGAAFSSESKAKSYYKQCTDTGMLYVPALYIILQ